MTRIALVRAGGALRALASGAAWIDLTSNSPVTVRRIRERRAAAARFAVETVDPSQIADTVSTLTEMTGGRGPDAVIDAVGMEAHGHDEAAAAKFAESRSRRPACCRTPWRARSPTLLP
jgi:threonine dehydrogenase-like Zn-dependent dehydrogenase